MLKYYNDYINELFENNTLDEGILRKGYDMIKKLAIKYKEDRARSIKEIKVNNKKINNLRKELLAKGEKTRLAKEVIRGETRKGFDIQDKDMTKNAKTAFKDTELKIKQAIKDTADKNQKIKDGLRETANKIRDAKKNNIK